MSDISLIVRSEKEINMSRQSKDQSIKREAQRILNSLKLKSEIPSENPLEIKSEINNLQPSPNIENQLADLRNMMQSLINQTTELVEGNKRLQEENNRLQRENKTFMQHFTEEFVALKRSNEMTLKLCMQQDHTDSMLPQDDTNSMFPQDDTDSMLPQDDTDSMLPQDDTDSMLLQDHTDSMLPQYHTDSMLPQYQTDSKLPQLPIRSVRELYVLEKSLADDKDKSFELMKYFERQVTDDVKNFVRMNLRALFVSDKLTTKFSWTAAKTNIPVKNFVIIKILKESALNKFPQTNNTFVEVIIKKYFNGAKDRENKAKKRRLNRKEKNSCMQFETVFSV